MMAGTNHDYVDVVDKQRHQYDAFFALKPWRPSPVLHPETTKSIAAKILTTPRMMDTINQLIAKGQGSHKQLEQQAKKILEEMGHTFSLSAIRFLGYFLAKLMRQLYQGVLINNSGLLKLSQAMSRAPVLLVPTHRSYVDFLLISYVCYTMNIPVPVIAAGMDFKGMMFVNRLLQNAGAFYIRRSFGQDLLYWSAVSEYIRYHMINFQAPIEFFLEGTRSRNGKSLPAKTGLLTMALEPYLKGEVPDILLCSISISYERILEENLYAYEVLGIPKPKESTSGFLSAVDKIRGENFGRIYVNISDPVSVQDHLKKRAAPPWGLPSYRFALNEDEKRGIHSLASDLVGRQQREAITPVSAVVGSVLSAQPASLDRLADLVVEFNALLSMFGTPCLIQGEVVDSVKECLEVHKLVFRPDSRGCYSYNPIIPQPSELQARSAARLVLQQYTNQLLGPLINVALFGYLRNKQSSSGITQLTESEQRRAPTHLTGLHSLEADIISASAFFAKYLRDEFILIRDLTQQDLAMLPTINPVLVDILATLLPPYVQSFYIILILLEMGFPTVKEIQTQYRTAATFILTEGASNLFEILAIDKVPRHLLNLTSTGDVLQLKGSQTTNYRIVSLSTVKAQLEPFLDEDFKSCLKSFRETSVRLPSQL